MGRKSREKRERREAREKSIQNEEPRDEKFEAVCEDLRSEIVQYSSNDVFLALCISDLWMPNISSQVKHALAWFVALSIPIDKYLSERTIQSYSEFKIFTKNLYSLLPDFPSMEDYIPETDWGEIKYPIEGEQHLIFYGGAVERVPDFISAYFMVHAYDSRAVQDMSLAIKAQNHILRRVDRKFVGDVDNIHPGHIETPSKIFWNTCRDALIDLSELSIFSDLSPGLIQKPGEGQLLQSYSSFTGSFMSGTALPGIFVDLNKNLYPICMRNTASAVIEHWHRNKKTLSLRNVNKFIGERFKNVILGPLKIVTPNKKYDPIIEVVILGAKKPNFIFSLGDNQFSKLPNIEAQISEAISTGDWGLQRAGERHAVQIRDESGVPTSLEGIVLILVPPKVSTSFESISLPKTTAKFFQLSDFITIFDSIKDMHELDQFWSYVASIRDRLGPFIGPADLFGSFRDTHGLLVEGAYDPTMIALDPHWGSNWRYKMLSEYWENAPPLFPENFHTKWNAECDETGLFTLEAKAYPSLSRCIEVNNCVLHFVFTVGEQSLKVEDGRILELVCQCLADSLNQRKEILEELLLFKERMIVTTCCANMNTLTSGREDKGTNAPLFSDWQLEKIDDSGVVQLTLFVNLQEVQNSLADAEDASFEVEALWGWYSGVTSALKLPLGSNLEAELRKTANRLPRFKMKLTHRDIDVPEFADPEKPSSTHFKIARRDLAYVFKDLGVEEGTYELDTAKNLIDSARNQYRNIIHEKIEKLDKDEIIKFCILQLDQIFTKYDRDKYSVQMSLTHEVNYDRTKTLAESHDTFIKDSRNYRYLLECCIGASSGNTKVTIEIVNQLIAYIDWLLVLYNASDVLHYGIDVAGLKLDHSFIPEIFYRNLPVENDSQISLEHADYQLGIGLNSGDEVSTIEPDNPEWIKLDSEFEKDTGVSFIKVLTSLNLLSRWPSALDSSHLSFSYTASKHLIEKTLIESVENMSQNDAANVIRLLTLDPSRIRKLIGRNVTEDDVPIWEHIKRGERYTIKPLIEIGDGSLIWGAAAAKRSVQIWHQSLINGYLPADFDWPNTKIQIRRIKGDIEKRLENVTEEILLRSTPYVEKGIDFKKRYPSKNYPQVGDYDCLAFFPDKNIWVYAECKYNQPPFCLKDARRLRERIFGNEYHNGHFEKIEKRRNFLEDNLEEVHELLKWPPSKAGSTPVLYELYISREIYLWMRKPPYSIPAQFIRVDNLEAWLKNENLID